MQLTEHFADTELGVANAPVQVVINAKYLADDLLEPIREHFAGPVSLSCGWRPPVENAHVGGKTNSYHLYTGTHAAADIDHLPVSLQDAFDWIRLQSGLPFDKVILEYHAGVTPDTPACIHLQIDSEVVPRRKAYTGYTGACEDYTVVAVGP